MYILSQRTNTIKKSDNKDSLLQERADTSNVPFLSTDTTV